MTNKIALVTGASSGIGKEIADKLCQSGFEVILCSRDKQRLNRINDIFLDKGYKTHAIPCDVKNELDVDRLYKKSSKKGFVSCVVNNAGLGKFSNITKMNVTDWDDQINTNLRGSFLVTRKFVKHMIDNQNGKIVFINSVAGKFGYPNSSAYVASKYGLRGFADSLRNELREHNIKVVSIYPGAIDTDFWKNVKGDFPREEMLSSKSVADITCEAITSEGNAVLEDVVIRRTKGDM